MFANQRFTMFSAVLAFTLLPAISQAQAAIAPAALVPVNAPTAQRLILAELEKHPEIVKIGLHAVPPTSTDNAIIACSVPSKIGKKSSPNDMVNLAAGKPLSKRIDKDKIFDLMLPITDAQGGDLNGGFVVMEVPLTKAADEQQALNIGIAIRDELQKNISSKSALYQR
jgi:hypothetical protein